MLKNKSTLLGVLSISTAAALWGFDGVVLTPRLYNLDVGFVVFMIHLIPFLIMNVFFFREYKNLTKFSKSDYLTLFLIALFGGAIGTLSIVKALFLVNFQSLSVVVLLQKLQPIFAISLAAVLLKERIKGSFAIWAVVAILSSYFLSFGFQMPNMGNNGNLPQAVAYAILAAFSYGSATVFGKKIMSTYHFSTATFFRYGFTSLIMLVYVISSGTMAQWSQATAVNWGILLLVGLTTGSGAIYLYYFGLNKVKAMVSTICEMVFPIASILFDYLFNGTLLSPVQMASAALMLFAIYRISTNREIESKPETFPKMVAEGVH